MLNRDLNLKCSIEHPNGTQDRNIEDAELIKEILFKHGITFNMDGDEMSIYINHKDYNRINSRNAGRKRKRQRKADGSGECYNYSDIVHMMQSMTDLEIIAHTGIAPATYNRHKKVMVNSPYYKMIDMKRAGDLEYLKSVELDQRF